MANENAIAGGDKLERELESSLDDLLALTFPNRDNSENVINQRNFKNESISTHTNTFPVNLSKSEIKNNISVTTNKNNDFNPDNVREQENTSFQDIPDSSHINNDTGTLSIPDDDVQDNDPSIEDMVANAMTSGNSHSAESIERTATEEDALTEDELAEVLEQEGVWDDYLDSEEYSENEKNVKWYKNKKLWIILGAFAAVILAIIITVIAIFKNYYSYLKKPGDYDAQPGVQDSLTDSDTVDGDEYDDWLKGQLAGIADKAMSNENVTNILIIAEDLRDTNNAAARGNTDVMMLASINKENKTITLSSFMRDIYCPITGFYSDRLNSAYAKGGPETLMSTLKSNFGIEINRYVKVNFTSFVSIIEAVGGIEADVTQAEADAMIAPMSEQNRLFGKAKGTDYLKTAGHYNLNGNQALAYSRIRKKVGDDFGRTKRQRQVIFTAINKVKELSLSEIDKLAKEVLKDTETNLTESEIASLLLNSLSYMNYTQQQLQIPDTGTWSNATIRGAQVLSVNFVKNAKILQETIYGKTNIGDSDADQGTFTNTQATVTNKPITNPPKTVTNKPATNPVTNPPTTTTPKPDNIVTTTPPDTSAKPTETTPPVTDEPVVTTTTTPAPTITTPPPTSADQPAANTDN